MCVFRVIECSTVFSGRCGSQQETWFGFTRFDHVPAPSVFIDVVFGLLAFGVGEGKRWRWSSVPQKDNVEVPTLSTCGSSLIWK